MTDFHGFKAAGPAVQEPSGELVPLVAAGVRHLAVVFGPAHRVHPLLAASLDERLAFLKEPGVGAVCPLVQRDRQAGALVYRTGSGRLLQGVLASPPGADPRIRAGLELIGAAAAALQEAAEAGAVPSHGALTPRRLLIRPDGSIGLVGYGVPAVEVVAYLDEETDDAHATSLRYVPPERIEDSPEDVRSDLYALALIAAELMLGSPVYEGTGEEIIEQILRGDGPDALEEIADPLPDAVLDLLCAAIELEPASRPADGRAWARQAADLSRTAPGPTLAALAADTKAVPSDATQPLRRAPAVREPPKPEPVPDPPTDLLPVPLEAPPPTPADGVGEEDVTQVGQAPVLPDVPLDLEPGVADLPDAPTLQQIKDHARRVVARCERLGEQAAAMTALARAEAAGTDAPSSLVRTVEDAGTRARKAAGAARGAGALLDLDEDAAGALVTLELVRNAERQTLGSATQVRDALSALRTARAEAQEARRALLDSVRHAGSVAERAQDAAHSAFAQAQALEQEQKQGLLSAPGVAQALDEAFEAAERGDAAARRAAQLAQAAAAAKRLQDAAVPAGEARTASEEATAALREVEAAVERARRAEQDGLAAARARAADHASEARASAEDAASAVARAQEALQVGPSAASRELMRSANEQADRAREAAAHAERAAAEAERATLSSAAREAEGAAAAAAQLAAGAAAAGAEAGDEVIQLAGRAAEAAAAVRKLTDQVRALSERAQRSAERARQVVDQLFDDTREVSGDDALGLRAEALESVQAAEQALKAAQEGTARAGNLGDVGSLEPILDEVRDAAEAVGEHAERAIDRAGAARGAAERELAELQRAQAAREAVKQAAQEARAHADACAEQVAAAWAKARNAPSVLADTQIEAAIRLHQRATEIIDIADFQAGEAAQSATHALRESDPAEARAHADTARSFAERIRLDLPEAFSALDDAIALAQREVDELERARTTTRAAQDRVVDVRDQIDRMVDHARALGGQWPEDPAVQRALEQLAGAREGLEEDLNEAGYAHARATELGTSKSALEMIPLGEAASARATDRLKRARALAEGVQKAADAAEADASALENARKGALELTKLTQGVLTAIAAAQQSMDEAIARHGAEQEPVQQARARMAEAVEQARGALSDAKRATAAAAATEDTGSAQEHAATAKAALARAEAAREAAADAQTAGVAAAEREAAARQEAEQRQIDALLSAAGAQARRAEEEARSVRDRLAGAGAEIKAVPVMRARRQLSRANAEAKALDELAGRAAEIARRTVHSAAEAEAVSSEAHAAADEVVQRAAAVLTSLDEAVDLARAAAAEAEALQKVKAEVQATVLRAEAAVARARDEAKRILELMRQAPRSEVRVLAEEARGHISAATKAAAKVKAAAPMAADADDLAVAQAILRTSRAALERAARSADAVRDLIEEVQKQVHEERERAAAALEAARAQALKPAQQAAAAAQKASGWLQTGRREAEEVPDSDAGGLLDELAQEAGAVREAALAATRAAQPAKQADAIARVQEIAAEVRGHSERAIDSARRARNLLDRIRDAIQRSKEGKLAVERLAGEVAERATTAQQVAKQADAVAQDLTDTLAEHEPLTQSVRKAHALAMRAARSAGEAADAARGAATAAAAATAKGAAETASAQASAALERAIDALEAVVQGDAACREKLTTMLARRTLEAAQAEEDKRKEEEAARKKAEDERQAEEDAKDEARRVREQERRERFNRRRAEREAASVRATPAPAPEAATPSEPDAPRERAGRRSRSREDLRSRLRSTRPPSSREGAPASEARPGSERRPSGRRSTPVARRAESTSNPAPSASERGVRSWSPSDRRSSGPSATRPRKKPAPPKERPKAESTAGETTGGADELLERLRSRLKEKLPED